MPRKRVRNPLKRRQVDKDMAPGEFVNRKQSKNKKFRNEEEGGAAPRAWTEMIKRQKQIEQGKGRITKHTESKPKEEKRGRTIEKKEAPTIQPGEKMGDFVRRVDQELPMVKARKGSPSRADKKKKKQRERAERQAEAIRQKKGITEDDGAADRDEEMWQKAMKNRDTSPDPFSKLESNRSNRPKFNEVADRPPELTITRKMKSSVPNAAGSMARRAMLEEERQRVIDEYRKLKN